MWVTIISLLIFDIEIRNGELKDPNLLMSKLPAYILKGANNANKSIFPLGSLCGTRDPTKCNTCAFYKSLASSGPYGPLLARSGYPGQDASFYNNPMVIICATVNAPTLQVCMNLCN